LRTLTLHLSTPPPSANTIWRTYKGRTVKSAEYQSWLISAGWEVKAQKGRFRLPEPSYWSTVLYLPRSKTRGDVDNFSKGAHDMLKTLGIVPDDRFLVSTTSLYWSGDQFRIDISSEPLEEWIGVMMPAKDLEKRLRAANKENSK
jgi:Holliday junction resolvase RusA-like endonuclease